MTFLSRTYSQKDKKEYYNKKSKELANHYNKIFNNHRVMTYDDTSITRDYKANKYIKKLINSPQYSKDMFKIAYYTYRADGVNHNDSYRLAKDFVNDVSVKNVVNIDELL